MMEDHEKTQSAPSEFPPTGESDQTPTWREAFTALSQSAKELGVHPSTIQLVQWFDHEHLAPPLQAICEPLAWSALNLVATLSGTGAGAELTTGLRKLLEAKDCLVRAALAVPPQADDAEPRS